MTEICNNVYCLESDKRMRRTFNSYLNLYQTLFRTPLCFYYVLLWYLLRSSLHFVYFNTIRFWALQRQRSYIRLCIFFFLIFHKNTFERSDYMGKASTGTKVLLSTFCLSWDFREKVVIDSRTRILELRIIKKNYCA